MNCWNFSMLIDDSMPDYEYGGVTYITFFPLKENVWKQSSRLPTVSTKTLLYVDVVAFSIFPRNYISGKTQQHWHNAIAILVTVISYIWVKHITFTHLRTLCMPSMQTHTSKCSDRISRAHTSTTPHSATNDT